jgi:hypothetical protein
MLTVPDVSTFGQDARGELYASATERARACSPAGSPNEHDLASRGAAAGLPSSACEFSPPPAAAVREPSSR